MKHYILILITLSSSLLADVTSAVVHSSVSTYYEDKTFKGSKQKTDGIVYGVGGDIHYKNSEYKFTYEHAHTNTRQPPLQKDLEIDKLFLRYGYKFNDKFKVNLNYINILNDNIAITDEGKVYGLGLTYSPNKKTALNFTQYYTNYNDFNVYQSDFKLSYKIKLDKIKIELKSITKYISIDEENKNSFTKFADKDYLTSGVLFHIHYNSYHLGGGAYMGSRAFAIMSDGFKIQHHAMRIDRTYALGVGKTIGDFVLRAQYIYQRAEEIPLKNKNIDVTNIRVILNYKF